MKVILLFAALLNLGMAREQPRLECPEYNVDYEGNNWWKVPYDITTWEECGKPNSKFQAKGLHNDLLVKL